MPTINPYLNFRDNCDAAFEFYKSVFGGEFATKMRFRDIPEEAKFPGSDSDLIMHVALPIGKGNMLMGSDAPEGCGPPFVAGTNMYVAISPDSEEEARRLFDGLSAGGNVTMPLASMFWGALFGSFVDKFGIQWMVNYEANKKS